MSNSDTGNVTTQKIYEIATQPIFMDRSQDQEQEISWEISDGQETPLPPQLEEVKDVDLSEEKGPEVSLTEEVEPESDADIPTDEEETEKKKKKNRISEKNRIAQLIREKKQAQSVAHDVLSRNQYLEAKIAQKEKEASENHQNYLTSQKEQIKKYLTDAIEEGDPAKITEANDLLAQYNSEILWIKKQNTQELSKEKDTQYPNPNSYQEPARIPFEETGIEWIEKNTWANPNSEDFDEEMFQEADNYSVRLARKYKLEGRGREIGTDDFFNEITDYIRNSYDIVNTNPFPSKPPTRDRMQMKTDKSPPVGSVTRQSPQGGESSRRQNDITLTPEQREMAHSLRGFVRDPTTGRKVIDNKTLEDIYKRNLMRGTA